MTDTNDMDPSKFELDELFSAEEDEEVVLDRLSVLAQRKARSAADYYTRKSAPKKFWATRFRLLIVMLLGLAALVPVLDAAGVLSDFWQFGAVQFDPDQLGYFAAGLAGILFSLDQHFGFSSGWVRFMTTDIRLQRRLAVFEAAWFQAALCDDGEPGARRRKKLSALRTFWVDISQIVSDETDQWATEFQSHLASLAKRMEAEEGRGSGAT